MAEQMAEKIMKSLDDYFEKPKRIKTWSGFPVKTIHRPEDVAGLDYDRNLGDAGKYPYTRGIYDDMYRGRFWTRRLGWGYGTPQETNQQFKFLLAQGNTGLNLFRDLPSVLGIDPDHPMARGEVGRSGVSIATIEDMREIFEGIPIAKVSNNILCASCAGPALLSFYLAVAQNQGVPLNKIRGTLSNDTFHGYFCYAREANPPDLGLKLAVDVIEFCSQNMPLWNAFYVNSYDLRDSGLNAPQEVAFGLSFAVAYIEGALARGLDIDFFAPRAAFYCNAGIDFFEEIAKLRAMRRMWAKLVREKYRAKDPRSWRFRFGVHTSGSSLIPQQPLNNIVRIAYEQMVAVLAGAQSVNSCTFIEPLSLPTELSQMVALRTQQILAYETGVALTADPLGGSYYVEYLTNVIEEEAAKIFKEIEEMGGALEAIKSGWIEREIEKGALAYQKEVENKERIIVGLNEFVTPPEEDIEPPGGLIKISPKVDEEQIARLNKIKEQRDFGQVKKLIANLREAAEKGENLVPHIIAAAKCYATLEEIQGTIREAFGYTWDPWGMRSPLFGSAVLSPAAEKDVPGWPIDKKISRC